MKACMFFASGYEECEALIVVDMLRRANVDIDMIGLNDIKVKSSHNVTVNMDKVFSDVNFDEYDIFILPGGMPGTTNLKNDERLLTLLKEKYEANKLICAICAAPSVLAAIGILDGKKATCFPNFRSCLTNSELVDTKCVQDGNVITACGLGAAFEFAKCILNNVLDKEKVEDVYQRICY